MATSEALGLLKPKTKVLRVRLRFVLFAMPLILLGAAAYFRLVYPGFTRGMWNQVRYSTMDENRNLWFCISYWLDFMQKLRLNPSTGIYAFDGVGEAGLDGLERGVLSYHRGEFARGAALIEENIRVGGETETKLFWLGMCCVREAEADNCLSKLIGNHAAGRESDGCHSASARSDSHVRMCSLPLGLFHDRAEYSRKAANAFEGLLDRYNSRNRLYQWLLNFCYMTVNEFPQEVPPRYLIKGEFIEAFYGARRAEAEKQFSWLVLDDRARDLGVDTYNTGRGMAVEDFDRDGYLDIVTGGSFEDVRYYRNDRGRKFIDHTAESGLSGIKQPFIISCADYGNDGWMDLFFGRPFGSFSLYRNNRDGTFTDVTKSSGLMDCKAEEQVAATWVSAWADVDNDGDVDLFLAQWGFKMPFVTGLMARPRLDSKLLINEDNRFVDRTELFGLGDVVRDEYFIGATFGDYDGDGFADLFLSSPLKNTSALLHNREGKRFEKTRLTDRTEGGFSAAFVDVNHDGRLDIFQAAFADATTSTEMAVFGENRDRYNSGHSTVLIQRPDGRFEDRKEFFDIPMGTMGASFGDINNDGAYDFYLGTGTPEGWFILPNLMYLGQMEGVRPAERTANVSMLSGLGTVQKGHGIVFFDFDNDGDQDIYSSLGGMWPADRWPNQFFVNDSRLKNSWVKIRLRGRRSNYFGLGATIKITARNDSGEEIVRYYLMGQGPGFGSTAYIAHIGLLNAVRIKEVEVYWPASERTKKYSAELNTLVTLDEGE
ncbi:MAG TPA: CRTAC1 family protein [Blastocatellia bacterium]|nr:CRTAC1 family protein [Blastocatellia bacterium]